MVDDLLSLHDSIRYVAVYRDEALSTASQPGRDGASAAESDRYEELLVNPTLLRLVTQRGNIDCGGLDYVVVRYGNFFQLVVPTAWGHVSVCVEPDGDPLAVAKRVTAFLTA